MPGKPDPQIRDLNAEADAALEIARSMLPGATRIEALKKASLLRNAADAYGISFAKRGRPPKYGNRTPTACSQGTLTAGNGPVGRGTK